MLLLLARAASIVVCFMDLETRLHDRFDTAMAARMIYRVSRKLLYATHQAPDDTYIPLRQIWHGANSRSVPQQCVGKNSQCW